MNGNLTYKIATGFGCLALTVGLGIFFTWWGGRAWFAEDLIELDHNGLIWSFVCFPLALVALIFNLVYLYTYYKEKLLKSLFGIAVILINIPVFLWVMTKQSEIHQRAYIKVYNGGKEDISEVKLESSYFDLDIGELMADQSEVICYNPEYLYQGDSFPQIKTVLLTFITKQSKQSYSKQLPRIDKGWCQKFHLDEDYKLIAR